MKIDLNNPKFLRRLSDAANEAYGDCDDPDIDFLYGYIRDNAKKLADHIQGPQLATPGPRAQRERDLTERAMAIYDAYPRKVARPTAIRAIMKQLRKGVDAFELLEHTENYADLVNLWPKSDLCFVPHPATWYNGERFKDDPATWSRHVVERKPAQQTPEDRYTDHLIEQMRKI